MHPFHVICCLYQSCYGDGRRAWCIGLRISFYPLYPAADLLPHFRSCRRCAWGAEARHINAAASCVCPHRISLHRICGMAVQQVSEGLFWKVSCTQKINNSTIKALAFQQVLFHCAASLPTYASSKSDAHVSLSSKKIELSTPSASPITFMRSTSRRTLPFPLFL